MIDSLEPWIRSGVLETASVQVAATFAAEEPVEVALALALAVEAVRASDTCVDLDRVRDRFAPLAIAGGDNDSATEPAEPLPWPGADWPDVLSRSDLVDRSGPDDDASSGTGLLVLEGSLVFLRRLWLDECDVADAFRRLHGRPHRDLTDTSLAFIDKLFDDVPAAAATAPREAVRAVLSRSLTIVTGGPGTGKTWTLARMLAALWQHDPLTTVTLAAPTGKAAKRMKDALESARTSLDLGDDLADRFASTEPVTLHRFLGFRPGNAPRFDVKNPVDADVVVVDEASMVSLPLMAQLVRALPDTTTLLLLGDPFQLASVEAGSVLGDLVAPESGVSDSVVRLEINHRSIPALDQIFRAVNDGDADAVVELLRDGGSPAVEAGEPAPMQWIPISGESEWSSVVGLLDAPELAPILDHARDAMDHAGRGDAATALAHSVQSKVLCATHRGPLGVEAWTDAIESVLLPKRIRHVEWYPGRPVMITRNDYVNGLFNGDTGITAHGEVVFGPLDGEGHRFVPEALTDVTTWWAMSIHKSQGSEFDHVVVAFDVPRTRQSVISRELLYTALTRARRSITVVASESAIRWAVEHNIVRFSGLSHRLR